MTASIHQLVIHSPYFRKCFPNLQGEAAARAERRLHDQTVIWLTTFTSSGQLQTSLLGYEWDGTSFLIVSSPTRRRPGTCAATASSR